MAADNPTASLWTLPTAPVPCPACELARKRDPDIVIHETATAAQRLGPLPEPSLKTSHDVRHLVVCANAKCRKLGDDRHMVFAGGKAHYHGRCFIKLFGLKALLSQPHRQLDGLTLGDIGVAAARALLRKRKNREVRP